MPHRPADALDESADVDAGRVADEYNLLGRARPRRRLCAGEREQQDEQDHKPTAHVFPLFENLRAALCPKFSVLISRLIDSSVNQIAAE
jgi:hypothetical protein